MDIHIDTARKIPRIRPFKAMAHMRNLLRDNEDTEQVFHIMECLNGGSLRKDLYRFARTDQGAARLKERLYLPDILDDHAALRQLPEGSVGRAYLAFMEREGLTAAGLVAESGKWWAKNDRFDDDIEYYSTRRRDTHDLFHVLTGYGRDQLGETSVLAFSYSQYGGLGGMFIAYIGGRDLSKIAPKSANVMNSIWEAKRHGKIAADLTAQHIPSLLKEPLEAARKRLNIREPIAYKHALRELEAIGYSGQLSTA